MGRGGWDRYHQDSKLIQHRVLWKQLDILPRDPAKAGLLYDPLTCWPGLGQKVLFLTHTQVTWLPGLRKTWEGSANPGLQSLQGWGVVQHQLGAICHPFSIHLTLQVFGRYFVLVVKTAEQTIIWTPVTKSWEDHNFSSTLGYIWEWKELPWESQS